MQDTATISAASSLLLSKTATITENENSSPVKIMSHHSIKTPKHQLKQKQMK